jgi:hypothetical protein
MTVGGQDAAARPSHRAPHSEGRGGDRCFQGNGSAVIVDVRGGYEQFKLGHIQGALSSPAASSCRV